MRASCFSVAEIDWSRRIDSVFRLKPHHAPTQPLADFRIAEKVSMDPNPSTPLGTSFRLPLGEVIPKATIAAMLEIAQRAQLAHGASPGHKL